VRSRLAPGWPALLFFALLALATGGAMAVVGSACGLDDLPSGPPLLDAALEASSEDADAGEPDAAPPDLGDLVDASRDAALGVAGFCAREIGYVHCWDFDQEDAGTAPLGFPTAMVGGGTLVVAADGVAPNQVFSVSLPEATGSRSVWVSKAIPLDPTPPAKAYELRFSVSVRSSSLDYVMLGAFVAVSPGPPGPMPGPGDARFIGASTVENGGYLDGTRLEPPRADAGTGLAFHDVRVVVGKQGHKASAFVQVDGSVVQREDFDARGIKTLELRLGAYLTSIDVGGVAVVFDDVILRELR